MPVHQELDDKIEDLILFERITKEEAAKLTRTDKRRLGNDIIFELIEDEFLSLQQLKECKDPYFNALTQSSISNLIKNSTITVEQLLSLDVMHLKALENDAINLMLLNCDLNIAQLIKCDSEKLGYLKNANIRDLIITNYLGIEDFLKCNNNQLSILKISTNVRKLVMLGIITIDQLPQDKYLSIQQQLSLGDDIVIDLLSNNLITFKQFVELSDIQCRLLEN